LKICFTLEGNYPYVRGGVSTWVDRFIRSLPQHEFVLWTISDLESKRAQFAYELPSNVVGVHENFLGSSFNLRINKNPNLKFSAAQREAIYHLIRCQEPDWSVLLNIFHLHASKPVEFFLSEEFLNILKEFAREQFPFASFSELFWTVRSMFLPLLFMVGQPIPEADLYHSPSTGYAGVLAALAAMKQNKPFVLTEHGIYTREREEELLRSDWVAPYFKDYWISMFFMFARFAYQHADRVTSLYHRASLIQQELGCPTEKCDVVRNGLDFAIYSAISDKPDDGWVDIAAIVRFAPIKDIKTMIYAFSRLKQEFERVRLHILGGVDDNEYYQECLDLINYLEIKDIILPGNVNVRSYLEKIDFTVLTSISEGQPFAVLESMAAKRPVVATDVGSCRELIEGDEGDNFGHAGICVPPMHQSKLLEAMRELCEDELLRKNMGLAGQQRIKKYYEIGGVMDDYLKVYEKAMATWQESVLN
jgi:glycosyltransferase involved in cell wall biosynthesis